jgi:hypothetical protein
LIFLCDGVLLAAFVISWIYRKNLELNPIRIYLTLAVSITLAETLFSHETHGTEEFGIIFNLISYVNGLILYYYFWRLIKRRSLNIILLGSLICITGITLYFWLSPKYGITQNLHTLFGLHVLFTIIPCLLFIYELFTSEQEIALRTNSHFYIACALLFYNGAAFPFAIAYNTLFPLTREIGMGLGIVSYFLQVLMNITIIKAFLCPYPERK